MTLTPLDANRAVAALVAGTVGVWALGHFPWLGGDEAVLLAVWVALFVVAYLALYAIEWWLVLRRHA